MEVMGRRLVDWDGTDDNAHPILSVDSSSNTVLSAQPGTTIVSLNPHVFAAGMSFIGLPTSSSGLPAGTLWNNGGVLCIA